MSDSATAACELAADMVQHQLRRRGIEDPGVLEAMRRVPRHHFVPDLDLRQAYSDRALPTAEGQTISQPYIVAKMTELLAPQPGDRVLEVGTGSGYQTAILAALAGEVVTIERHPRLVEHARQRLRTLTLPGQLTLAPIQIVVGDGTLGHPPRAPYNRILVTAGAPALPPALGEQLAEGGRLVLPLGDREGQQLTIVDRRGDQLEQTEDIPCRFVPLVGRQGWQE
ncbi:MAG: protein-L-isoaspartate(D-aspartate) O-methyltransferase [Phycisphaeraceae bacterium]